MKSRFILYERKYVGDIYYTFNYYPLNRAWSKTQYLYNCPAVYLHKFLYKVLWVDKENYNSVGCYA